MDELEPEDWAAIAHCAMAAVVWTMGVPIERNENFESHVEKVEQVLAIVGIKLKDGWWEGK